jgi:hypothetical protein
MKKDPQFYHVPGWFEYVSALGASLLVSATGMLFRDTKFIGPAPSNSTKEERPERQPLLTLEYLVSSLSIFDVTMEHVSVGLQGSCILILDPDRFNLTVGGRRRLFSWTRTTL